MGKEMAHRLLEGRKILVTLGRLWKGNRIFREVREISDIRFRNIF